MYLLDTNVISGARVRTREPRLQRWLRITPASALYTAASVLAEIEQGVRRLENRDASAGAMLRAWFDFSVLRTYGSDQRALPFDLAAARIYATFPVPERAPSDDAHIAAIAVANGLIVVTRNVKHFEPLGVRTLNPWEWSS